MISGKRWLRSLVVVPLLLSLVQATFAQQRPTIEERLIRLEEGQRSLERRIDDLNQRIGDVNRSLGQRIDDLRADINRRFDDFQFWLQFILGALVLIIGGLIAQWLMMWQRLIRVDTALTHHLADAEKDQLLAFQREEIRLLKERLDRLEGAR